MNKLQCSTLFVLMMMVTVWAQAGERESNKNAPRSAVIVLEGVHSREGIGQTMAISIINPKTIAELEAFFPKYRTYPSSNTAGGWEAGYRVYFNFAQGRSIRVTVSENGGGDTWSIGEGDFGTRGDFAAFVKTLQRRASRTRHSIGRTSKQELYANQDYEKYVQVAVIDPKWTEHVQKLLEGNRIPNIIEGSVVYGVSVPPDKKDHAVKLLKADVAKHGYSAKFSAGSQEANGRR